MGWEERPPFVWEMYLSSVLRIGVVCCFLLFFVVIPMEYKSFPKAVVMLSFSSLADVWQAEFLSHLLLFP